MSTVKSKKSSWFGFDFSSIQDTVRTRLNQVLNPRPTNPTLPTYSNDGIYGRISNDPPEDAPNSNNFQTLLEGLSQGNVDDRSLQTMLDFLSTYMKGNPTDERNDMFYQFLLQWLSNSEQRGYDYNMLQEGRQYNNPLNQLLRYTGAGISRDAAIQMMSGSAGGSGVGSSAGIGASAPGVSAPSGTMDLQRAATIYNGIYGGIAAINQLMQSGMSFAQGLEQVQAMHSQNVLNQQQSDALGATQDLTNALYTLQQNGDIKLDDYNNINDVLSYIQENSESNVRMAEIVGSSYYKTATGSMFGRQYLNQYWNNTMKSRSDGDLYNEYVRGQKLNNFLTQVNTEKAGSELSLIDAQTKSEYQSLQESAMRIATMQADIKVKNAQGEWIQIQTDNYQRLADAQYNQMVVSIEGQEIQNQINRQMFELNSAGFPMLKQIYVDKLSDEMAYWSTINDPKVRDMRIQTWFQDSRNAQIGAYVENLRINAVGDFANANPTWFRICNAFHATGASNFITTGAKQGAFEVAKDILFRR